MISATCSAATLEELSDHTPVKWLYAKLEEDNSVFSLRDSRLLKVMWPASLFQQRPRSSFFISVILLRDSTYKTSHLSLLPFNICGVIYTNGFFQVAAILLGGEGGA